MLEPSSLSLGGENLRRGLFAAMAFTMLFSTIGPQDRLAKHLGMSRMMPIYTPPIEASKTSTHCYPRKVN